MSVAAGVANRVYMAAARPSRARFERAVRNPVAAQREILSRILRANARSAYGRRYDFARITSVDQFRECVPVADYDAIESWIQRSAHGEAGVLSVDPIRCFERTGGSSGANKLVPITSALLREFGEATLPWVHDLLARRPALRSGRSYWAVTPPARLTSHTEGGIPIGLEHDSDYFPRVAAALLDRVIGTPRVLSRSRDVDAWRYLTLRALLAIDDLAFISIWNPSFLTLLAATLDEQFDSLLHDLEQGTLSVGLAPEYRAECERDLPARPRLAAELRRQFGRRAPEDLGLLWPRLSLISCWADAHAARALPAMRARFPRVEVQSKGLLATEGVVSFPVFAAGGAVAAVSSHYLEFMPVDDKRSFGVEELEQGTTYRVLLTTSGGLYRYALNDLVRVDGWHHRAPVLSFLGRADTTSDLAGEKLTPAFAERVLQEASRECGIHAYFAMLAPTLDEPPRYDLLVECDPADADRLAEAVEHRLADSHQYALCRRLGQLERVRAVVVRDGARLYERSCLARGQRISAIKPPALGAHFGGGGVA